MLAHRLSFSFHCLSPAPVLLLQTGRPTAWAACCSRPAYARTVPPPATRPRPRAGSQSMMHSVSVPQGVLSPQAWAAASSLLHPARPMLSAAAACTLLCTLCKSTHPRSEICHEYPPLHIPPWPAPAAPRQPWQQVGCTHTHLCRCALLFAPACPHGCAPACPLQTLPSLAAPPQ